MRVALIADIHGNLPALEAMLADIEEEEPDQIVCLGDVSTMGPFPVETLERVRELDCHVIMGNGDAAALDSTDTSELGEAARRFAEMDAWSASQLSEEHCAFVRTFSPTIRLDLPGDRSLLCVHGSPRSYNDVISATTPNEEVDEMLEEHQATIIAGGHWHFQMLRRHKGMTLFNPGSVGLPYDVDSSGNVFIPSRVEYGIVNGTENTLRFEHRRVDYDTGPVLRAMRESDFPHADWWSQNWR